MSGALQNTLRGTGGDIIYGEEAAYLDQGVFYKVIVPLLMVRDTVMILISTPTGQFGFYSMLTEIRDENGRRIFNVLHAGIVCDSCSGTPDEDKCTHAASRRPEWNPDEDFDRAAAIYGEKKTLLQRELMGKITDDDNAAYSVRALKHFFRRSAFAQDHDRVENVYVGFDPNGGASTQLGSGSETAIVSFFIDQGRVVVCGLDAHNTDNHFETLRLVRAHVRALRSHECFREARIVLVPEANLGNEAQIVAYDMIRYQNIEIVSQYPGKYGIFTVPGSRGEYVLQLGKKFDERAVFYHDTVVVANPFQTTTARARLVKVKGEFERQMAMFEQVPMTSKNLSTANRILYTGVANNEGERITSKREDMAMAFAFGYYWAAQYDAGMVDGRGAHERLLLPNELPVESAAPGTQMQAVAGTRRAAPSAMLGSANKRRRT